MYCQPVLHTQKVSSGTLVKMSGLSSAEGRPGFMSQTKLSLRNVSITQVESNILRREGGTYCYIYKLSNINNETSASKFHNTYESNWALPVFARFKGLYAKLSFHYIKTFDGY